MGQFTVPVAAETRRVASRQNRFNTPAIRSVMESLRIAASNGYVRLYLDEGAELENLLRRVVDKPQSPTPALSHARTLLPAAGAASAHQSEVPAGQERPTERELQILRVLTESLFNSEMAGRLVLTEGTVKWHLHNLYAKLGVRNRTGALCGEARPPYPQKTPCLVPAHPQPETARIPASQRSAWAEEDMLVDWPSRLRCKSSGTAAPA